MAMAMQLSDDQLKEIQRFFESQTGEMMFNMLQASCIADWINEADATKRDEHWRLLQVIFRLHATLRDSAAMKKLTQRAQERRIYAQP